MLLLPLQTCNVLAPKGLLSSVPAICLDPWKVRDVENLIQRQQDFGKARLGDIKYDFSLWPSGDQQKIFLSHYSVKIRRTYFVLSENPFKNATFFPTPP